MPKRGENIHKRKDGRWEGRYKMLTDDTGKTRYHSVYGHSYSEVKEKLKDASQEISISHSVKNKNRKFKEVLFLWMETNRIKHKGATEVKYDYLIEKHILPELGNIKLASITTLVLNDFMERKLQNGRLNHKGGLSPAYVRNIMLIVTSALQYAVNEQMCLPLNTPVFKPAVEKKDLSILSIEEQKFFEINLMKDLDETKLGILISLHTGLRIGEVCALSWNDIDLNNNIIHVRSTVARVKAEDSMSKKSILIIDKPKTKASIRDIPICSSLYRLLVSVKNRSKSKYVVSSKADFISPRTYEYRFHKLLKACHLKPINYHALRHTFATRCIEVGMDVKTLSEILGHANVSITLNTYVHPSMDLKRIQLEKLSAISA